MDDLLRRALTIVAGVTAAISSSVPGWASQDLVLSGRLVKESGFAAGQTVRLSCPGFQARTWASGSGYFTVRMPRPGLDGSVPERSAPTGKIHEDSFLRHQLRDSVDCVLEVPEQGPAFTRFEFSIPTRSRTVHLGDLHLPDRAPVIGRDQTLHWSSLAAPPGAIAACEEVRKEVENLDPDLPRARKLLEDALHQYPDMAEAWGLLGVVANAQGATDAARSAFEQAVTLDPSSHESLTLLAQLEAREGRWAEALDHCDRALAVKPSWLQAHYLRAFAAYNLGDPETARMAIDRIEASGATDRFSDLAIVDSLLLAQEGDLHGATTRLENFLEENPNHRDRKAMEAQLKAWAGSISADPSASQH